MHVLEWNTRDLAARDRFPFWHQTLSQTLVSTWPASDSPADFNASARLFDFGAVTLSAMSHSRLQVSRPAKLIRQADPEVFQLHLVLAGDGAMTQAGREARFAVNHLLLIDSSQPWQGWRGAGRGPAESLIVQFPRSSLGLRSDMIGRLVAAPFPARAGITGVLAAHLRQLTENAGDLTRQDAEALGAVTLDLVAAACAHRCEATRALAPESRHQALLSLIHHFIRQRLGDPDLNAEMIAAAHGISVRHLYKIFQEQGVSVAGWIRRRRLEGCHRDLADPLLRARPIQTIAARWGFSDAATFSRNFRAAFGMSPRDHRHRAADDAWREGTGLD
ncbi:helix-turn-helix domain-containing protein [Microbispora sp. H10670]|uniref:helix-turn-helix domain-containing protein n=1 Tax=Microbispora sp. H10670 TaxID=2729108 RepID=UPI002175C347|nr:helix-turn-helix domain-containing protein [Microbispora sp. H10670]